VLAESLSLRIPGKPVLVPLTTSLYVPGKLVDVETVVVDIGTGYYVKKVRPSACSADSAKTKAEALAHYTEKTAFVQKNLDQLQATIERKQENAQSVVQVLQMKMQQAQAAQAQAA
jgi:prefoldin alpha subunit